MITSLVVALVTVSIISFFVVGGSDQEQVYAQTQKTNFTQLFSTDREFQRCLEIEPGVEGEEGCVPIVKVAYQDPTLLVLKTIAHTDSIWKAVALAQKEGYQIDAMTSSPSSGSTVNLLVAMSK